MSGNPNRNKEMKGFMKIVQGIETSVELSYINSLILQCKHSFKGFQCQP